MLNILRYLGWFLLEKLKSDSVYSRLQEIEKCMADDVYYQNTLERKLDDITSYAADNTVFYRKYKNHTFKDFPVTNKNIIMSNFSSFKSEDFKGEKVHIMSTSGSTGIPFKVEQDFAKRRQVLAEIIYYTGLLGYKVGRKLVYLRNLESGFGKSKLKSFLQNQYTILTQKYDSKSLSDIVDAIIHMEKNTTVLGYASTLQMVASYMQKNNIFAKNVTGVISGSETLTPKVRKLVEEQFGCMVVSRYSNQEMGVLAQESQEDKFILNRADYYFEMLDLNEDKPVENGHIGRIVITDLYNKAMPMIRYDTGDLGIVEVIDGKEYLAKVCGRKLDLLYTTSDEPITFFAFDEYFENNYDIEQYQIIQEDRTHITVNLIMKKGKTVDDQFCIESIKNIMGKDCMVTIKYLNEIPITNSGKFRYVICKYTPKIDFN